MNKYKLNYLRWLTGGEVPDDIMEKSFDWKIKDDKISFRFKAKVNCKDWRFTFGSAK